MPVSTKRAGRAFLAILAVGALGAREHRARAAGDPTRGQSLALAGISVRLGEDLSEFRTLAQRREVLVVLRDLGKLVYSAYQSFAKDRLAIAHAAHVRATTARVGRNEPCPCGSGKKYKRCCLERTA